MSTWDLSQIRKKVRRVTGRYSDNELTNDQVDDYINKYYQFTFPAEVKLEEKLINYDFITLANQQVYSAPTTFTNFMPEAYINNKSIDWYQDQDLFFANNAESYQQDTLGTGDGATVLFSTTITDNILPGSSIFSDGVENFYDTNTTYSTSTQNLTGSLGGTATINYSTGAVSVTFNTAPADGTDVYFFYVPYVAGEPKAVLYSEGQFKLYPVPDTGYKFRVKGYQSITALSNSTDTPEEEQWGELIAYGASKLIYSEFGEIQALAEIEPLYKEQLSYVLRRNIQDLFNFKTIPQF